MQDIFIDHIKLNNVRCHFDMEMDFPVDNFTVIVGKNGSGKSTILKSISMALFGDDGAVRGERLSIGEMVNKKVNKNLEIELRFRITENEISHYYDVMVYYNHSNHKNKMFLLKDGVDISGKNKSETYKIIENLLVPRDVYHNSVYFSQQVKDFFTALTNSEQKEIFDSILSLKVYDKYYENTTQALVLTDEQATIIDSEISQLETMICMITGNIETLEISKTRALKENDIKISDTRSSIILKQNEVQVVDNMLDDIPYSQEIYDQLASSLAIQRTKQNSLQQDHTTKIRMIEDQEKKDSEKLDIEKQSEINARMNSILAESGKKKQSINNLLSNLRGDINQAEQEHRDKISNIENIFSKFQEDAHKDIQFVLREISKLEGEFSTKDIEALMNERLSSIDNQTSEIENNIGQRVNSCTNIKNVIDSKKKEIQKDEESISGEIPICTKCLRPFSDLENTDAIKRSIEEANQEVNELESEFVKISDEIKNLEKDCEEIVCHRNNQEQEYKDRIQTVLDKREARESELRRKETLLNQEIEDKRTSVQNEINQNEISFEKDLGLLKEKEKDFNLNLEQLDNEIENSETKIRLQVEKELEKRILEQNKKYLELQNEAIANYEKESISIRVELTQLENESNDMKSLYVECDKLSNQKRTYQAEISSLQNRIKEFEDFEYNESSIEEAKQQLDQSNSSLEENNILKQTVSKEIKILNFWKDAFSDRGIKSMLIDMAIPYMNESISNALERVAPGVFTVSFDTLSTTKGGEIRDKFNVNILHNIKGTDSHKMLSGGEKRLVDLCCMEALRDLAERLYGKRFHNIFYDEVLDSLDDDSSQAFCQVSKLLSADKNVTLITHNIAENLEPDRIFKF